MTIATAHITHIRWRDGRPRFDPGPQLRALGYKSRDLKHPDGTWFTYEEARSESKRISAEVEARGLAAALGQRPQRPAVPGVGRTLSELCEACFELPEFKGTKVVDGKKVRKGLSPKTVEGYRKSSRAAEQACARMQRKAIAKGKASAETLWHMPAAKLSATLAQLIIDEVERHAGLYQARAVRAFLSQMWGRLAVKEPGTVKGLWRDIDRLPSPQGRIRPWSPEEFRLMIEVADAAGRPEMGDSFVLGALTATRQTDRLQWTFLEDTGTHIEARQSKTGKLVSILKLPYLAQRLEAARERRAKATVHWPHLLIDEQAGQPWHASGDHYRKVFTLIRKAAAKRLASCATLRDQDLRDTAQTWLDQAKASSAAIASVTGHELASALAMQKKHYIAENRRKSDDALRLLGTWLEGKL